jgi:glycosyltransferase involved in cell wall biosynthesis
MDWMCCQIGAREHYAVPRVLHQSGKLACLFTDFWAGPMIKRAAAATSCGSLRSLAARFHPGVADASVTSWNTSFIIREATRKLRSRSSGSRRQYNDFLQAGRRFASGVRDCLRKRHTWPEKPVFFSYDTGALEAMEWCRGRGVKCVLGQMDPNRVEVDLVREEEKRWPGWQTQPLEVPEEYFRRREEEWALADRVLVNSEFCREALIQQGVRSEKLVVVPLCYERELAKQKSESGAWKAGQPLRVLFLGQVILRKGIQYLLAAARLLEQDNIQFDVVGPIGISEAALASAPRNVVFHGRTGRNQAGEWYRQADLFVLPTLSDGFAITQLEAMSHGLPVIATSCCGAVVSDGVDGFIIPTRDAGTLARTVQRYIAEPALLKLQRDAALAKAEQFTLERLGSGLQRLEADMHSG